MPPKPKTPRTPPAAEERPATPVEPIIENGTFYYDSGAMYEGDFTMAYESGKPYIPPAAEDPAVPAKKDDKKCGGRLVSGVTRWYTNWSCLLNCQADT
eukprot:1185353-Prorocentrum_minimum.AAC.2